MKSTPNIDEIDYEHPEWVDAYWKWVMEDRDFHFRCPFPDTVHGKEKSSEDHPVP